MIEYKNCSNPDFASKGDCEGISITGGYVHRGRARPGTANYFFGDWSKSFMVAEGALFAAMVSNAGKTKEPVNVTNIPGFKDCILGFGQDNQGNVHRGHTCPWPPWRTGQDLQDLPVIAVTGFRYRVNVA